MKLPFIFALLLVTPTLARAEERPPIIDMHLHARRANYIGPDPMPMCAPFVVMPRSDPKESVRDLAFNVDPPCENPIPAATTDEQVMRDTIAVWRNTTSSAW